MSLDAASTGRTPLRDAVAGRATAAITVLALIGLCLAAGLRLATGRADAQAVPSAAHPIVVELYTSEGCSSCPPAEAQLGRLAQQEGVIALAFHVDYWDQLGWRDRFGLSESVDRQRQYARTLHLPSVYTPQLVINGTRDLVGGGADGAIIAGAHDVPGVPGAANAARAAGSSHAVPVDISVQSDRLLVTLAAQSQTTACDVMLLGYLPQADSKVTRGENAGRQLHEVNIVRSMRKLGSWQGEGQTFSVPLTALAGDATGVVVLVQQQNQGAIVGAGSLLLRSGSRGSTG